MTTSNVTAEMQAAVGRQIGRRVSFPVSESDIRRWALAVYWPEEPPPLFWDAEYAKNTRHGGIIAPEEFNPFAWMVADKEEPDVQMETNDTNRTEILLGVPGPGLKFQLNGGMEVEYGVPMRPDDVITSVSRLAEYREREGRLGLMLFTVTEDVWSNQDDDEVKRTRSTLIRY
jgi:hypothetical protein